MHCPVQYCSNDLLVEMTVVMGRSFYDFVSPKNEQRVREWIDMVKAWGVNERGQPSDGGFGFGRFTLLHKGRDSRGEQKKTTPSHGSQRRELFTSLKGQLSKTPLLGSSSSKTYSSSTRDDELPVDAIFSAHSDGILIILQSTAAPSSSSWVVRGVLVGRWAGARAGAQEQVYWRAGKWWRQCEGGRAPSPGVFLHSNAYLKCNHGLAYYELVGHRLTYINQV